MVAKNVIKKIREQIMKYSEIELAYLYGSYVLNKDYNDIDIAIVVSSRVAPPTAGEKLAVDIEKVIKPRITVDVKILNFSPVNFKFEVIGTGKIIFSKNEKKRIEYEEKVMSEFLDYKETSDWFDQKLLKDIAYG